jgi:hypothetical protein
MTKQDIKEVIVGCRDKLKHVPTLTELVQTTELSHRQIRRHFGGYMQALRECNLEAKETGRGARKLPLEKVFVDWAGVVRRLKKLPSISEYELLSPYTSSPLVRRFGSWRQVPQGLKQFAQRSGLAEAWKDELDLVTLRAGATTTAPKPAPPPVLLDRRVYGPPMSPVPLAYGPVNETGVIFLFGAMAQQLGFVVHRLQTEFPDCEAMRRIAEDKWQYVRIEFEYESRNFLRHMHDPSQCDLIVCWRHNWPDCPLEVVELRNQWPKSLEIQPIAPKPVPRLPGLEN